MADTEFRDVGEIIAKSEAAWSRKENRQGTLNRAYSYGAPFANPHRNGTGDPHSDHFTVDEGDSFFPYDGTLVAANNYLQGRLVVDFFPPNVRWATVRAAPSVTTELGEPTLTEKQLQDAEMTAFRYIHDSNFDYIIGSVMQDFTTAGVCFIGMDYTDSDDRFKFNAISQAHMAVEVDQYGEPVAFYQRAQYSYGDLVREYGENAVVGLTKPTGADAAKKSFKVTRACLYGPLTMNWENHVLLKEGGGTHTPRYLEDIQTFKKDQCPFIMGVWMRSPDETYGTGPVIVALYEFMKLNYLTEKILHATEYATEGLFAIGGDICRAPAGALQISVGSWWGSCYRP